VQRTRIEFGHRMWSVTEGCLHGCSFCWSYDGARRFRKGDFTPKLRPDRLQQPYRLRSKESLRILVSLQSDLFGSWVPSDYIRQVIEVAGNCPRHHFLFLTKNPARYAEFAWPANAWIGTSVETQEKANERIPLLLKADAKVKWVNVEPMLGPVDLSQWLYCYVCGNSGEMYNPVFDDYEDCPVCAGDLPALNWVVCGQMTGRAAKVLGDKAIVKPEWVQTLIEQTRAAGVPIFLKDNLHWPERIQQYPKVGDRE
jgi:protein gp37